MYMSSRCTNDGAYNLTVTFKLGMDSDMAQVLVQNRVSLALPVIPPLVQNEGITVKKMSPNTLMIVNLISPDGRYDAIFLSNYATIYVKDELGRLPGVAGITYLGQRDYSLRAWLDPDKLAALNLSAMDVVTAISQQNVQVAAGQIGQQPVPTGQQFQLTINTLGRLTDPEQFADIIVKAGAGQLRWRSRPRAAPPSSRRPEQLEQPGAASSQQSRPAPVAAGHRHRPARATWPASSCGSQQYDQSCTLDGQPSVALSIYQLPGSNALDTASGVYAKMKELKTRFPDGLDYQIVYDTTPFIRESVNEVFNTLRDAVILVAIVVLVFLQDWRAMILPMIDVPVSLIGTFAVMAALGFTLNNLTLFGLVLAIGIVVDDAIVVLENIERQIATGLDARTRHHQGHGGDHRPGPGHHAGAQLGVHAVLLPRRHQRPVLPPVRRDHRRLDDHLGHQRPDHDPLAGRADLQDRGRRHGHEHHREALPWWIFGVLGGACHRLAGASTSWPVASACRRRPDARTTATLPTWLSWAVDGRLLPPRRAGRRRDRLVHHPAGERRAGLVLPGLQPLLRPR